MKSIRILSILALILSLVVAFTSCGVADSVSGLLGGEITFDEFLDSLGLAADEDDETDPPAGGDETDPPAGGDETDPPAGGDETDPPAGGDETDPPAGGDETDPPAGGDETDPPAGGDETDPPAGGDETDPPAGGDETEYPAEGEYRYAIDSYVPLTSIPAFEGKKWTVLNGNVPYFVNADKSKIAYAYYSDLDSLGRAGLAVACLGPELLPTGNRKDPTYDPTGWIQKTYSGDIVTSGNIWNRSHLIAWSLAGDSSKENLVTGTPYFNQLAMTEFEDMVRDYVKETGNHVLYRVAPVFVEGELVCRGVTMEAFSLEDNGGTDDDVTSDGLYFNVFIHNVNPGIIIDYATGETSLDPNYDDGNDDVVEPEDVTYVVNVGKNPNKIHEADCSSVTAMSEKNKVFYTCTYDEVVEDIKANGKTPSPCGTCHPEDKKHDPK